LDIILGKKGFFLGQRSLNDCLGQCNSTLDGQRSLNDCLGQCNSTLDGKISGL